MKLALSLLVAGLTAAAHSWKWDVWYGGDPDGRDGFASERNFSDPDGQAYDHFTTPYYVPVDRVYGSFFDSFEGRCTTAFVDIRTGVSSGNGGVRVFSGVFDASSTDLGYSLYGYELYRYTVDVGIVELSPGTYFLAISPIQWGNGRDFVASTSGANSINNDGHPDDNQFMKCPVYNFDYERVSNLEGGVGNWDLSYGVTSSFVPEPAPWLLLGAGGLLLWRRKERVE